MNQTDPSGLCTSFNFTCSWTTRLGSRKRRTLRPVWSLSRVEAAGHEPSDRQDLSKTDVNNTVDSFESASARVCRGHLAGPSLVALFPDPGPGRLAYGTNATLHQPDPGRC